ncbi:MAG: hypothetical protein RMK91_05890 [Pseudanabaenaceae cyanobacterium SKYGB_i_bin29]|nr:hypothetical protein [Pseudanabaenaceae cyanobacterium SKYG29]MDW8421382.1 hypothetical protein [Pseudanabaenaceae cyanobacterium SKYGB_i_bin29]
MYNCQTRAEWQIHPPRKYFNIVDVEHEIIFSEDGYRTGERLLLVGRDGEKLAAFDRGINLSGLAQRLRRYIASNTSEFSYTEAITIRWASCFLSSCYCAVP